MRKPTRRDFVKTTLATPLVAGMGAGLAAFTGVVLLTPTPACADDDEEKLTPDNIEGPYFKPQSPKRVNLIEAGIPGEKIKISGHVWNRKKKPLGNVLIDFWQCDGEGVYDNKTFKLRGHQFTAEDGTFALETVFPGIYTGRTRHIHVKTQAPQKAILTTQLYFPDEAQNKKDRWYKTELTIKWLDAKAKHAEFNFVLDA